MANVVFMDGFDAYDANNNNTSRPGIHSKWIIVGGDQLNFPAGRYGGRCAHFGDTFYGTRIRAYFEGNTFYQTATFGFALLHNNVANAEAHSKSFSIMHDQGTQMSLDVTNIGQMRLWRGDTVVAVGAPNVFHTNDWHFVELEYVGHTSAGRATVYVDGVKVLEFTGNTQALAPYGFNGIMLYGGSNSGLFYDDLFVIDQANRIGERRIETLRPNGDVTGNQFTPSTGSIGFNMLDDDVVSADDYVSATAVGAKDLYNFSNLSTVPNKIDAVQLSVWATKTDAETRQMRTIVKSGSTETESKDYNLPTNHLDMNRIENKDPATGTAWTVTGVNAVQAGFKITK